MTFAGEVLREIGRGLQILLEDWPKIDEEKYLNLTFFEKMHVYSCYNYAGNQGWDGKDFSKWPEYLDRGEAEELRRILAQVEDPAGLELTGYFILEAVHHSMNVGTANERERPTSANPRYEL